MEIQLSIFDMGVLNDPESELIEVLKRGSGYSGGCLRIYAAEQLLEASRFPAFLADEFGIGGHSIGNHGFVDYGSRGLVIRRWKNGYTQEMTASYSWKQVAEAYHRMIAGGLFPEESVILQYHGARKAGKGAPAPRMCYYEEE